MSCSRFAPTLGRLFTMNSMLTSFSQPFFDGRTFPRQIRDKDSPVLLALAKAAAFVVRHIRTAEPSRAFKQ